MFYELSFTLSVLFCSRVTVCELFSEEIIFSGDPDNYLGVISTDISISTFKTFVLNYFVC